MRLLLCGAIIGVMTACSTGATTRSAPSAAATEAPSAQPASPTPSPAEIVRVVTGTIGFQSPTHNIRCDMYGANDAGYSVARCEATSHTWAVPPRPANGCGGDWYGRIAIDENRALFICASEALAGGPVLPYGHGLRDGSIICDSTEQGVKCTSQITGHGFTLSRQAYTLY